MLQKDTTIRIAFADDQAMVRKGISEYIKSFDNCSVEFEASNGKEMIEKLEKADELPHICILDIFMPEMNGLETLTVIKERWPEIKVLVLTGHSTEYYMPQMLKAGANGYLLKDCEPEELEAAIREIHTH